MDASHAGGARKHDRRRPRPGLGRSYGRRAPVALSEPEPVSGIRTLNEPAWCLRDRSSVLLEFPSERTRIEDVRERARLLAATGTRVSVVLAGPPGDPAGAGFESLPDDWEMATRSTWPSRVRERMRGQPDAALVAAGDPDAIEDACRRVGSASAFHAWPTVLTGEDEHDRDALEWGVAARAPGISARSSLWDGDYLLVPGSPDPGIADAILTAFADVADDFPALDLVFLGDLPRRQARAVRASEVCRRVHAAGAAPLRAECAWLAGASLVILPAELDPEASAVIRALASGAPIVVPAGVAGAATLGAWLDARGARVDPDGRALDAVLGAVLGDGGAARTAAERAAVWARGREWNPAAASLRAARRRENSGRAA